MLLTLGLDSQFALLETVQTAILDRFPHLREHKIVVLSTVTILGYLLGLVFCTQGGIYWLQLFDKYAASFSVLIIAISECTIISWYYGAERFLRDIEKMIGSQSYAWTAFWTFMWKFATPSTLIVCGRVRVRACTLLLYICLRRSRPYIRSNEYN